MELGLMVLEILDQQFGVGDCLEECQVTQDRSLLLVRMEAQGRTSA